MNNIDQSEVAKFDAAAPRWWDTSGELKTLHEINPLRLSFIEKHCQLAGKKILDVGCGGGILAESLAAKEAQVTGIDMSEAALKVAKLHLLESQLTIDYQQITAEEFAEQQPACFDVITCMEMLEHVPHPESVVKACSELVKPGGTLFFSTISRNAKAYVHAILGAEYILKMLPKGTHDYQKFIRPSELARYTRKNDLQLEAMAGIKYNLVDKSYSLSDKVDVNYMACVTKI
jgi:2-polyprenyl-6-hydroxyphenyl methylase/3-demethylubiquinone-9 3-methyltransferase